MKTLYSLLTQPERLEALRTAGIGLEAIQAAHHSLSGDAKEPPPDFTFIEDQSPLAGRTSATGNASAQSADRQQGGGNQRFAPIDPDASGKFAPKSGCASPSDAGTRREGDDEPPFDRCLRFSVLLKA